MNNWQLGDIDINGLNVHYTRTGGAKPAVVLAHGFSDDGLCWTPVAEILQADYDVVMVDARGHGRSSGPEQGYGSAEHAGDIAGLITGLGLQRPAVLGHSMGAATAIVLGGTYPELPRAILLEDPPAWWAPSPAMGAPAHRRGRSGDWIIDIKRKTREEMIAFKHAESPNWPEPELGPWADSKLRFSFNALNDGGREAVDWPAVVGQISCPALLITADCEKGAIVTPEAAAAFQALAPGARVAHIAGAGHNIRREQFERYMDIVKAFLAETAR